ncbi:MAG: hypothetical protein Rubg2KO_09210 [Rubricoccaceae bacterium]
MRLFILLVLVLMAPSAFAQTASLDSVLGRPTGMQVVDGLDASSSPPLADELVQSVGSPWSDIRPTLPAPDSSKIENGLGNAWWSAPGFPVDGFRAFVQHGLVESVTLDFSPDGPDLPDVARRLYDRLGSPRADGFYATDQTGYPFSLAIDALANRLTVRAVPGQVVTD